MDERAAPSFVLVSIPFIAGQWSLRQDIAEERANVAQVSIPFIAGQWSLLGFTGFVSGGTTSFQSPSLRGSGRFARSAPAFAARLSAVSIPFIAGQWSLHVCVLF